MTYAHKRIKTKKLNKDRDKKELQTNISKFNTTQNQDNNDYNDRIEKEKCEIKS